MNVYLKASIIIYIVTLPIFIPLFIYFKNSFLVGYYTGLVITIFNWLLADYFKKRRDKNGLDK